MSRADAPSSCELPAPGCEHYGAMRSRATARKGELARCHRRIRGDIHQRSPLRCCIAGCGSTSARERGCKARPMLRSGGGPFPRRQRRGPIEARTDSRGPSRRTRFPRRQRRGPIEAISRPGRRSSSTPFPRRQRRGPIEARPRPHRPAGQVVFPRRQRRGPIEAAGRRRAARRPETRFHGGNAVAQLKRPYVCRRRGRRTRLAPAPGPQGPPGDRRADRGAVLRRGRPLGALDSARRRDDTPSRAAIRQSPDRAGPDGLRRRAGAGAGPRPPRIHRGRAGDPPIAARSRLAGWALRRDG